MKNQQYMGKLILHFTMLKFPYSTSDLTLAVGNFAEVHLTDRNILAFKVKEQPEHRVK